MYFLFEEKIRRELEFEYLEQEGMWVAEYLTKFISLQRFAPSLLATEKIWANQFFEGLIYPIKLRLATVTYTTLDEVVNVASRDERIHQTRDKTMGVTP